MKSNKFFAACLALCLLVNFSAQAGNAELSAFALVPLLFLPNIKDIGAGNLAYQRPGPGDAQAGVMGNDISGEAHTPVETGADDDADDDEEAGDESDNERDDERDDDEEAGRLEQAATITGGRFVYRFVDPDHEGGHIWYAGHVGEYDAETHEHQMVFDDGESRTFNFVDGEDHDEDFRFVTPGTHLTDPHARIGTRVAVRWPGNRWRMAYVLAYRNADDMHVLTYDDDGTRVLAHPNLVNNETTTGFTNFFMGLGHHLAHEPSVEEREANELTALETLTGWANVYFQARARVTARQSMLRQLHIRNATTIAMQESAEHLLQELRGLILGLNFNRTHATIRQHLLLHTLGEILSNEYFWRLSPRNLENVIHSARENTARTARIAARRGYMTLAFAEHHQLAQRILLQTIPIYWLEQQFNVTTEIPVPPPRTDDFLLYLEGIRTAFDLPELGEQFHVDGATQRLFALIRFLEGAMRALEGRLSIAAGADMGEISELTIDNASMRIRILVRRLHRLHRYRSYAPVRQNIGQVLAHFALPLLRYALFSLPPEVVSPDEAGEVEGSGALNLGSLLAALPPLAGDVARAAAHSARARKRGLGTAGGGERPRNLGRRRIQADPPPSADDSDD